MAQLSTNRRRWPRWLLVAAIVLPVIELVVLLLVGNWIGLWPLLALLVVGTVVGGALLAREVPRSWRSLREALRIGAVETGGVRVAKVPTRLPTRELADGALVLIGGALLLAPGFVTDLVGIYCLLPLTRPLPRRMLISLLQRRAARFGARMRGARSGPVQGQVVQGRAVDPPRPAKE